jgi:O-antigen/teichoic acid export membrane protein
MGASAVSQFTAIIAMPLIARIYDPDAMGTMTLFLSLCMLIGSCVSLRYDLAVVLPRSQKEASNLLVLSVATSIGIALLLIPLLWAGLPYLLLPEQESASSIWFLLVPLFLVLFGTGQALRGWHTRHKRFPVMARGQIVRSLCSVLGAIGPGMLYSAGPLTLIFSRFLGALANLGILLTTFLRRDWGSVRAVVTLSEMRSAARRHWRFPVLDTSSVLLFNAAREIPVILLVSTLGTSVTGLYGMMVQVLQAPVNLVAAAIGQVIYQQASAQTARGEKIDDLIEKVLRHSITLGALPAALIAAGGGAIFAAVLGEQWREAGVYGALMSPWLLSSIAANSTALIFRTLQRQDLDLAINALLLVGRVAAVLIGGVLLGNARTTVLLLSLVSTLLNTWRIAGIAAASGCSRRQILRHLLQQTALASPVLALTTLGAQTGEEFFLFPLAAFSTLCYILLSIRRDPEIKALALRLLPRR